MGFTQRAAGDLLYHTASCLEGQGAPAHGFSTRTGGVSQGCLSTLNLRSSGPSGDQPERVKENFRRLCAAVGADVSRAVLSVQVHEDTVRLVTEEDAGKGLWRPQDYTADALITDCPNLPLFVFSADCIVILLWDAGSGAVGAVHAGWRGTALGIAAKTVREMERAYGTRPENIRAAIGAGIGPCCFETHDDVPQAMLASPLGEGARPYLQRTGTKWLVDLKGLNCRQLVLAGVPEGQIDISPLCTACHPELYWSHRKMGNQRGVQAAVIMHRG